MTEKSVENVSAEVNLVAEAPVKTLTKKRNPPPSAEEIEAARKRARVELPEGMSRNQYKKLQRQKKWDETKSEYRKIKKEKKKAAAKRRKEQGIVDEETNYHMARRPKTLPKNQIATNVHVIMDCEFDELMNQKEIVSLSNQIARSYSAKRHCEYEVSLKISSFNKTLKQRFDKLVSQYKLWKNIEFEENDKLADILPIDSPEELSKYVYLTADTDEVINDLEPDHTYIIGGIVDKNRHKLLCVNKAKELGLRVGKLPIDKYIEMNGRQVLATSHVYELCCKWFETGKDWGKAFNEVLPPRKVKKGPTPKPEDFEKKVVQDKENGKDEEEDEEDEEDEDEDEYEEDEDDDDEDDDEYEDEGEEIQGNEEDGLRDKR